MAAAKTDIRKGQEGGQSWLSDRLLAAFFITLLLALLGLKAGLYAFNFVHVGMKQGDWWGYQYTYGNLVGFWQWPVGKALVLLNAVLWITLLSLFFLIAGRKRNRAILSRKVKER